MSIVEAKRMTFSTALGTCALAWDQSGLVRFELPETVAHAGDAAEATREISQLIERVRAHFEGELQDFSAEKYAFHLVPDFARKVYRAALDVKPGRTATYGDLAAAIGESRAVSRAVGAALGANPWPLLIPCHRIVAANGKMTGFSGPGGVSTKVKLLALEGAQLFAE
jgi:methylated-DNA-[protein]-cysteine S-methyltransferase